MTCDETASWLGADATCPAADALLCAASGGWRTLSDTVVLSAARLEGEGNSKSEGTGGRSGGGGDDGSWGAASSSGRQGSSWGVEVEGETALEAAARLAPLSGTGSGGSCGGKGSAESRVERRGCAVVSGGEGSGGRASIAESGGSS